MEIGKVSGVSFENNVVSGVDSSDFFASSGYIIVPAMEFRFDTTLGDGLPELIMRIPGTIDAPVWSTLVDWGDGTVEEQGTIVFNHTYSTGGVYDVKVYKFGILNINNTDSGFESKDKIIDIKQLSRTIVLRRLSYCSELTSISSITTPVLSSDLFQLFRFDGKLSTVNNINSWDLSGVTNLDSSFSLCSVFNQDISGWNVSNVDGMSRMFQSATSFNQDISGWNVSNVDDMSLMLASASSFDQDLGAWTFKNNCNLSGLFAFSGMSDANVALCLEGWDKVGQGTGVNATDMFGVTARTLSESTYPAAKAAYDNLISTYGWDLTNSVNWVDSPLILRLSIANDGDSWDPKFKMNTGNGVVDWGDGTPTEPVTTSTPSPHTYATAGTYDVTVTPVGGTKTETIAASFNDEDTQITEVVAFGDCVIGTLGFQYWEALTTIPLDGYLDLTGITFFRQSLFRKCSSFVGPTSMSGYASLPLGSNLSLAFDAATLFNRPGLNDLDTSSVTNMSQMFSMTAAFNQPLNSWVVSGVADMGAMFFSATAFDQDISGWNVSGATDMGAMFFSATAFNQDISGWDVSGVTTMFRMFRGATAFDQNLGAWTFKDGASIAEMFLSSGISDANLANTIIGWNAQPLLQGTSVNWNDLCSATLSESATVVVDGYDGAAAKSAYDNIVLPTGSGGLGWTGNPLITWVA